MKNLTLLSIASALFCTTAFSQSATYTQINTGLNTVTFDLGYSELEVADMNNDGALDLLSIGDHGSPNFSATEAGVMVWLNNGTGTSWTLRKTGAFGYGGIAVGDVNNDGKMDIGMGMHHNYATTDFGDQLIEVALGNGTAQSWTPYDDGLATNGETYGMFGVDFADVNNDGLLDIGANSFGFGAGIHIYKNNGNGTWTQTDGAVGGNAKHWLKFGDLNNDGNTDCVTASELGMVFSNNGSGFFSSMENGFQNDWYMEFDLADVNNDGAKDIGLVDSWGNVRVYTYNTTSNSWVSISNGLPSNPNYFGISIDDFNMDGNKDLIAWAAGTLSIYKGDGNGNWTLDQNIYVTETQFSCMNTGDFNHDGFADIAYLAKTSSTDNVLRVYLSTPNNPTLTLTPSFPRGNECFASGSVQFISWTSSVPTNTTATVKIEFSSNGNSGPYTTIANNIPNSGMYQWVLPNNVFSSNCFLRYTITNGNSTQTVITSAPFGIGTCSFTTGIASADNGAKGLIVYPNPVNGDGYIQFNLNEAAEGEINILDILGKKVMSVANRELNAGMQKQHFNVSQLEAGVYLCELNVNGTISTAKFIVVK